VIRAFVVPAFMSIAGRWNWYPGRFRQENTQGRPTREPAGFDRLQ